MKINNILFGIGLLFICISCNNINRSDIAALWVVEKASNNAKNAKNVEFFGNALHFP